MQRYHPNLAARTRFVNPLIVLNYLRSDDDGVVRTEFQRIVDDDNGNDAADFLFLLVTNADPEDPNSLGNHWSLLFVDRSDRGRPVAYHYDSYGGLNNKDAEHPASRLDLRLEPAWPGSGTAMIAASSWWTARGRWLGNWSKDGSHTC
ncbi:hypothetical protein HU230_0041245 [Bradyrhizobium quebecense]|uniref:hypothetical protein n=1 Tax=Bradyrhizobium quebecense TaxID=2748629 RepID=UPI001F42A27B|nr:hypothetical protein [Bradyrhizobium quebecense]UGA44442.1 hypothetical protein HU230_0041245 [Bradyrhizobium quebecense]